MKKSAFIFASANVAAMMCVFTGCSDDSDEYIQFPKAPSVEVINRLATTTTPIVFKSTGRHRRIECVKGDKWINYRIDSSLAMLADLAPFTGIGPAEIIFKDGKVFCSINTVGSYAWTEEHHSTGDQLTQIWKTYVAETYPQNIYVASGFDYNKKTSIVNFAGQELGLFSSENSELILSTLGEDRRIWEYYIQTTASDIEWHLFDNIGAAYQFILACAREKYGQIAYIREDSSKGEMLYEREVDLDLLEKSWNDGL